MIVFTPERGEHAIEWKSFPLTDTIAVSVEKDQPVVQSNGNNGATLLQLIPWDFGGNRQQCLLVCAAEATQLIRVNGLPMLSLTALDDRDEIALGTAPFSRIYVSFDSQATVVPFQEGETPTYCARSKTRITEGTPAVQCPNPKCRLWYIETEEMPAYSYDGEPCVCGRLPTMGYAWAPEPIELSGKSLHDLYGKIAAKPQEDSKPHAVEKESATAGGS